MANVTVTAYDLIYETRDIAISISQSWELQFIIVTSIMMLGFIALIVLIDRRFKGMYQLISEKLEGKKPQLPKNPLLNIKVPKSPVGKPKKESKKNGRTT